MYSKCDEVTFNFANFVPSRELSENADTILSWLMNSVPFDAEVSAVIKKMGPRYYCQIDIYSSIGIFTQAAHDFSASTVIDRVACKTKDAVIRCGQSYLARGGTLFMEMLQH
mgnify:CR=1 FL=1